MRAALEQRRAALLKAQADAARAEKERKLAVRYHKVKFFGARAAPRRAASSRPEQRCCVVPLCLCAPAERPLPRRGRAQEGHEGAGEAARRNRGARLGVCALQRLP